VSTSLIQVEQRRRTVRVAAGAALVALSGLGAERVFDNRRAAALTLVALPAALIAVVGRPLGRRLRWALQLALTVALPAAAVVVSGGRIGEADGDVYWRGWALLTSTDWPSPGRPELFGAMAFPIAIAAAFTAELTAVVRWRGVALLPATVLGLFTAGLSAPAGPPPGLGLGAWLAAAAVVLALASSGNGARSAGEELATEARGVAAVGALCLGAASLVGLGALQARADPRRNEPATVETDALNPISRTMAERLTDPPIEVFRFEGAVGSRFRTQILDRFDGVVWSTTSSVRPVSRERLTDPGDGELLAQTLFPLNRAFDWVPVSGRPVGIGRDVSSTADRAVLLPDEPVLVGESVSLTFVAGPERAEVPLGARSAGAPEDDQPAWLESLAGQLAGEGRLTERLARLEQALRDDYTVNPVAAKGVNLGLLKTALIDDRNGTPEQFAVSFALMARSLGATSRLALGYSLPPTGDVVTTRTAVVWPEVWFDGIGWVSYDPVPIDESEESTGTRTVPTGGGGEILPTPAVPPRQEGADLPDDPPGPATSTSSWLRTVLVIGTPVSGAILVMLLVIAGVLAAKRRRRASRLGAATPGERILGAWAEATDRLVELGVRLRSFQTNGEIVAAGARRIGQRSRRPLSELATVANQAAHSGAGSDELSAALAVRLLGQVEQTIGEQTSRRRRWRARLSVRPFRRSTRSPVR
jgi:transglutaminase-like putative cysteine protease